MGRRTWNSNHIVRRFLLATPLPKLSQIPELDPVRFQSLDRAIVNAKWLPSILSLQAYHSAGFPSDHYPLELVLRVKLAQRKARPPKQFALDYPTFSDVARISHFNSLLRAELSPLTPAFSTEPPPTEPEVTIYTDGSEMLRAHASRLGLDPHSRSPPLHRQRRPSNHRRRKPRISRRPSWQ